MDILWGEHEGRPEDADELTVEKLQECTGDVILVHPKVGFTGRQRFKPKGKWIELRPDFQATNPYPKYWSNFRITTPVGIIAGFDQNLSFHLANLALQKRFEKLEAPGNFAFLNGPNLNLLGTREPKIYGTVTLQQIYEDLKIIAPNSNFLFHQTNSEGELVNMIQKSAHESDAIIINAAAYTHTSIAVMDALKSYEDQIIELHISNPHQRENIRHTSFVAPAADSLIAGFGAMGYKLALTAAHMRL